MKHQPIILMNYCIQVFDLHGAPKSRAAVKIQSQDGQLLYRQTDGNGVACFSCPDQTKKSLFLNGSKVLENIKHPSVIVFA